jgi:sulfur-carrier protein
VVKIILPSVWTAGGQTQFEAVEGPLDEIIRKFATANPVYRARLLGPDSEPLRYINIFVDDNLIPRQERAGTTVPAGSTITIISPMAGG